MSCYHHLTLNIENRSNKAFELFMQIVPREQEQLPDDLLELIHMKVYHGTDLIYDGTARGGQYAGSVQNLQNVISLGNYAAGSKKDIRVELTLEPNTPMEYADVLSRIDWKFMVNEEPTPDTPGTPATPRPGVTIVPKTGDFTDLSRYIVMMCVSGSLLAACIVFLAVTKKRQPKKADASLS